MPESPLDPLISSAESGDAVANPQLFRVLYGELRRIAERELRRSGGASPLSPTTVLHEAYIAIAGRESARFPDRARFMAYAARVMRGLIIDNARGRGSQKRGGAFRITSLNTDVADSAADAAGLEHIGEALDALGKLDERLAQVVDLKFFCGFSFAEIAAMHEVSERTVQRDWDKARILLRRTLQDKIHNHRHCDVGFRHGNSIMRGGERDDLEHGQRRVGQTLPPAGSCARVGSSRARTLA